MSSLVHHTIRTLAALGLGTGLALAGGQQQGMECDGAYACQFARWDGSGAAASDLVGREVERYRDVAVVGAPGRQSADVYVLNVFGEWHHADTLVPPPGSSAHGFGESLGVLSGYTTDYIAVGAPQDDTVGVNGGAVFLYERQPDDTWIFVDKLLGPTPFGGGRFGTALSGYGGLLAVGQPASGGGGYVHVLRFDGPSTHTSTATQPGANRFGAAVSLRGTHLIVGDPGDDEAGLDAGAIYNYRVSWQLFDGGWKHLAPDGQPGDTFGSRIDNDFGTVVAGAPGVDSEAGASSGAAYVYETQGAAPLTFERRLKACEESTGASFGYDVSVDGQWIFVGAPGQDGSGAVYAFRRSSGSANFIGSGRIDPPGGQPGGAFGAAVDSQGAYPIVGAAFAHGGADFSGAVYPFSMANDSVGGGACPAERVATAIEYGDGKLGAWGLPTLECEELPVLGRTTRMWAYEIEPGRPTFLLFGLTPVAVPFDLGHLYVQDPFIIPLPPADGSGYVEIAYPLPVVPALADLPLMHQVIYQDSIAHGPHGTGQTNGLALFPGS